MLYHSLREGADREVGNRSGKECELSFGHTEFLVVKILEILAQIKYLYRVICCPH